MLDNLADVRDAASIKREELAKQAKEVSRQTPSSLRGQRAGGLASVAQARRNEFGRFVKREPASGQGDGTNGTPGGASNQTPQAQDILTPQEHLDAVAREFHQQNRSASPTERRAARKSLLEQFGESIEANEVEARGENTQRRAYSEARARPRGSQSHHNRVVGAYPNQNYAVNDPRPQMPVFDDSQSHSSADYRDIADQFFSAIQSENSQDVYEKRQRGRNDAGVPTSANDYSVRAADRARNGGNYNLRQPDGFEDQDVEVGDFNTFANRRRTPDHPYSSDMQSRRGYQEEHERPAERSDHLAHDKAAPGGSSPILQPSAPGGDPGPRSPWASEGGPHSASSLTPLERDAAQSLKAGSAAPVNDSAANITLSKNIESLGSRISPGSRDSRDFLPPSDGFGSGPRSSDTRPANSNLGPLPRCPSWNGHRHSGQSARTPEQKERGAAPPMNRPSVEHNFEGREHPYDDLFDGPRGNEEQISKGHTIDYSDESRSGSSVSYTDFEDEESDGGEDRDVSEPGNRSSRWLVGSSTRASGTNVGSWDNSACPSQAPRRRKRTSDKHEWDGVWRRLQVALNTGTERHREILQYIVQRRALSDAGKARADGESFYANFNKLMGKNISARELVQRLNNVIIHRHETLGSRNSSHFKRKLMARDLQECLMHIESEPPCSNFQPRTISREVLQMMGLTFSSCGILDLGDAEAWRFPDFNDERVEAGRNHGNSDGDEDIIKEEPVEHLGFAIATGGAGGSLATPTAGPVRSAPPRCPSSFPNSGVAASRYAGGSSYPTKLSQLAPSRHQTGSTRPTSQPRASEASSAFHASRNDRGGSFSHQRRDPHGSNASQSRHNVQSASKNYTSSGQPANSAAPSRPDQITGIPAVVGKNTKSSTSSPVLQRPGSISAANAQNGHQSRTSNLSSEFRNTKIATQVVEGPPRRGEMTSRSQMQSDIAFDASGDEPCGSDGITMPNIDELSKQSDAAGSSSIVQEGITPQDIKIDKDNAGYGTSNSTQGGPTVQNSSDVTSTNAENNNLRPRNGNMGSSIAQEVAPTQNVVYSQHNVQATNDDAAIGNLQQYASPAINAVENFADRAMASIMNYSSDATNEHSIVPTTNDTTQTPSPRHSIETPKSANQSSELQQNVPNARNSTPSSTSQENVATGNSLAHSFASQQIRQHSSTLQASTAGLFDMANQLECIDEAEVDRMLLDAAFQLEKNMKDVADFRKKVEEQRGQKRKRSNEDD